MSSHRFSGVAFAVVWFALPGPGPASASDLLSKIASFLGISATPSQMKAPEAAKAGEVWLADAASGARVRLTRDAGYRWPVFDPVAARILALRHNDVVEIPLAGSAARRLTTVERISKLIGFDREQPGRVLVLRAQPNPEIAILSLTTGELTPIRYDADADSMLLAHLRGNERAYGDTIVYLRKESRTDVTGAVLEWTDVYIKKAGERPKNVSRCDGVDCSQPSLSADRSRIAFVRAHAD
jgi:hypothetical protein